MLHIMQNVSLTLQMSRHVMMMAKCTRWETSGRRNTWVPSVPVPAMEDNRCVTVPCWIMLTSATANSLCVLPSELRYVVLVTRLCLFVSPPFRAGVVRTAEGQEDTLRWTLTSFNLLAQMSSTGTEKTLCVNWSVSHYIFIYSFATNILL